MQEQPKSHLFHFCKLHLRLKGEIHSKTEPTRDLSRFICDNSSVVCVHKTSEAASLTFN